MQPGKTKNQNRPLRTYHTYQPDVRLERVWAGGKSSQSQNAQLSMQVREPRMDDNRASMADNLRKISPSCVGVGSEKFFSTVVSHEKYIYNFRLFHCVQPTKIFNFETWICCCRQLRWATIAECVPLICSSAKSLLFTMDCSMFDRVMFSASCG